VPHYRAALAGDLPDDLRRSAYLGLGSTCRTLGRYAEAEQVLHEGLRRYPEANEMRAFLAMVEHNLGRSKPAVEGLLRLLVETSADPGIRAYAGAIAFYAGDVDRVWPAPDE
jgi:thioredoxin-like negative regulator of GroEL